MGRPIEQQTPAPERERRRQEKRGIVISDKMEKTVVVEVQRLVMHPLYGKYLRRRSRFMAHDEANACSVGDRVRIQECRPLSRHKRWLVKEILEKAAAD
jgi:small subunit ribosomal protein S17